ncbi:MAG TPA: glyceraldehyde dehydrogenase subunit alpha [Alphaproteobacteria bacterium]|nr:glyceraldehyde dehydrogenase subunit alpha [Alphaproteobacteria bacterium]
MATSLVGSRIKRREDPRLIMGRGTYVDDVQLPRMTYAAILRSPYAHARIRSINVDRAKALPGVVAVITGADLQGKNVPCGWTLPDMKVAPHPALAVGKVRYTGDAVAVVVAEERYIARDALDLIEVDYEPLPVVVDAEKAIEPGAPQLHDEVPNNTTFVWKVAGGDVDKAFREAEVVVKERIVNQRLIPNAIEPRGIVAQYNPGSGDLTMWSATQIPHLVRLLLSMVMGIPEHKIRVIAPEVGGGFGSKLYLYPEEVIVATLAKATGRPVKWIEERRENYVATTHGRDHVQYVEVAAKRDGTITGLRVKSIANMGAYLSTFAPGIPTILFGLMLSGNYRIPNISCEVVGVHTNTTLVDAYRGAGRPEATYLVERAVDLTARELGLDPAEVRRRNFVPANAFPYTTVTGVTYDSGDYQPTLEKALEMVGYQQLRQEQARLRQEGKYLGIGVSTYVEICGMAPSQVLGAVGAGAGGWESATVRVHPSGKVTVYSGASAHGQGHETAFAQIVADGLGIPFEDVEVVHGDTAQVQFGIGTFGSRSAAVGGMAIQMSLQKIEDKAKKIAAFLLEAAEADLVFEGGKFFVKGSPGRDVSIQQVAFAAYVPHKYPTGLEPGLEATSFYDPSNFTWPFGTHVAVVEVDPETGVVKLRRYVAVDDCGRVINPLLVDGQIHGGLAQGIAQALYEEAVYDENGQLISGSLMDYAVPKADDLPNFELDRTETPSPVNALGVKGIGEAGTIASSAAIVNAVVDALAPLGVRHLDMPLKPERVWQAIQKAQARR